MRTGRKPVPRKPTLAKTRLNALPRCPNHLSATAQKEWRRLATPLHEAGMLTLADRSALAAYCQAYGRWAEAETKLAETPALLKTPSGYVQQSPWWVCSYITATTLDSRSESLTGFVQQSRWWAFGFASDAFAHPFSA